MAASTASNQHRPDECNPREAVAPAVPTGAADLSLGNSASIVAAETEHGTAPALPGRQLIPSIRIGGLAPADIAAHAAISENPDTDDLAVCRQVEDARLSTIEQVVAAFKQHWSDTVNGDPALIIEQLEGTIEEKAVAASRIPLLRDALIERVAHDEFGVQLLLDEVMTNHCTHGINLDLTNSVDIDVRALSNGCFEVDSRDSGAGYDPAAVPDATSDEFLGDPHLRGSVLMKHFADSFLVPEEDGGKRTVLRFDTAKRVAKQLEAMLKEERSVTTA